MKKLFRKYGLDIQNRICHSSVGRLKEDDRSYEYAKGRVRVRRSMRAKDNAAGNRNRQGNGEAISWIESFGIGPHGLRTLGMGYGYGIEQGDGLSQRAGGIGAKGRTAITLMP